MITLEHWYDLHDDVETLLRKLERMQLTGHLIASSVWAAHDELERVIIKEQSKLTEEELETHA